MKNKSVPTKAIKNRKAIVAGDTKKDVDITLPCVLESFRGYSSFMYNKVQSELDAIICMLLGPGPEEEKTSHSENSDLIRKLELKIDRIYDIFSGHADDGNEYKKTELGYCITVHNLGDFTVNMIRDIAALIDKVTTLKDIGIYEYSKAIGIASGNTTVTKFAATEERKVSSINEDLFKNYKEIWESLYNVVVEWRQHIKLQLEKVYAVFQEKTTG